MTAKPMTVTADAQDVLADLGMDRDDALLTAKSLAQKIIDESASTSTPLTGVVYAVWGLYNEGMPECEFAVPDGEGDLVFSGKFRAENGDTVTKRQRVPPHDLRSIVEQAQKPGGA